jgi:hypothetical protein
MQSNGTTIPDEACASEIAACVCGKHGHRIQLFETGKFLCIQCGMYLDEIRNEKPKTKAA